MSEKPRKRTRKGEGPFEPGCKLAGYENSVQDPFLRKDPSSLDSMSAACDETGDSMSEVILQQFLQENADVFWEWTMRDKNLHEFTLPDRQQHIFFFKDPFPIHDVFYLKELRASKHHKSRQLDVRVREDTTSCFLGKYAHEILWPLAGTSPQWRLEKAPSHLVSCDNARATKKNMARALEASLCGSCADRTPPTESLSNLTTNYYDTGFCSKHLLEFARKQGATNNKRPRHMLCLETPDKKKVFLKWCTRCKKWKNFLKFLYSPKANGLATHCTHCVSCSTYTIQTENEHTSNSYPVIRPDIDHLSFAYSDESDELDTEKEPLVVVSMLKNKFEAFLQGQLESEAQRGMLVGLLKSENEERVIGDALEAIQQIVKGTVLSNELSSEVIGQARVCLYLVEEAASFSSKSFEPGMPTQDQILRKYTGAFTKARHLVIMIQAQYLLAVSGTFKKNIIYLGLSLLKSKIEKEFKLKLFLRQWKEGCLLFCFQIMEGSLESPLPQLNHVVWLVDCMVHVNQHRQCELLWESPNVCISIAECLLGIPQSSLTYDFRLSKFQQLCKVYPILHSSILCRVRQHFLLQWETGLKDWKGNNPLHYAVLDTPSKEAQIHSRKLISVLLTVDFFALFEKNNQGFTPLDVSAILNHTLFECLLQDIFSLMAQCDATSLAARKLKWFMKKLWLTLHANVRAHAMNGIATAAGKALGIFSTYLQKIDHCSEGSSWCFPAALYKEAQKVVQAQNFVCPLQERSKCMFTPDCQMPARTASGFSRV